MNGHPGSSRRAALGFAVAALLATAACARTAPAAEQQEADGARLFAQACAKCHGAGGEGGLPMAANGPKPIDLRDPAWQGSRSDAEITAAIRQGRGAMPPFAEVIGDQQIAALVRHVRELSRH